MKSTKTRMTASIFVFGLAIGMLLLAANPANADGWSFQIEPYLIAVNIDGDVGIGRVQGEDIEVDTSDILDNLEMGGMVHFEAHHDSGWGFALDYAFMDLGAGGPRGGVLDADVFEGVFEAMLIKDSGSRDEGLGYFAGLRWWDIEVDVEVDPVVLPGTASRSIDEDWVDVFIGARWRNPISDKWLFSLRGDVGAGSSDFSWQFTGGFRYSIGDSTALDLAYFALGVDYESGTTGQPGYFMYDTITHGPAIGFVFGF